MPPTETQERRERMYNSPASRDRRADENRKPGPAGNLAIRHLDERNELAEKHRAESAKMEDKHRTERNGHLATAKPLPGDMAERHAADRARMEKKHTSQRDAMTARHRDEKQKVRGAK